MIYYMLRERSRRVGMTHKIGAVKDPQGISFFLSDMREMSNVNTRMALGVQD